jgi:hypothetical protein
MKPALNVEELAGVEYWNFPAMSKEIMRRQAALEYAKPLGVRVLIGGDANAIRLTSGGFYFTPLGALNIPMPEK